MKYALAADLGGTQMRAALVDRDGAIFTRRYQSTEPERGRDDVFSRLLTMLENVAQTMPRSSIAGLGLSFAGSIDPETGTVKSPPNLPGWEGFSPKSAMESRLEVSAWMGNDATLAALAEHRFGAGRGSRHMLYLTLSTGIGGGIIMDGRPYAGRGGFAGEVGHIVIDRNGPACKCGGIGCLEALASGTAVARIARERLDAGETSVLVKSDDGGPDARFVAEAASAGDRLAQDIMAEVATCLGKGIVSLLNVFDPELIVVGGGMSESLDQFVEGIRHEIDTYAMVQHRGRMPLVKTALGDDSSLIGAAVLVFDRLGLL